MAKNFCERLVESFESRPERTAMRIVGSETDVYTFGQLLGQIRSIAYRLKTEGIEYGDRIALIGENHPSWAAAYLGIMYRGAVVVPMDPHGEIETLTNFLENSEAKLAFLSPDQTSRFDQIQEKLGRSMPAVVWNLERSSNGFQKFEDWTQTEYPESFAKELPPVGIDDVALLMYTSGTTGTPKGVPLTHGNILAEIEGTAHVVNVSEKEKILSLLPLFHTYLQIVNLWVATTYGCEVGYLKELTPAELSSALKTFKPTILTTVPRLWYMFHKRIFDAVAAKPRPVRMLFRTMLAANGFLRDTLKVNLGPKFFGQVHESFGGRLSIAISAGSRFDESVAIDFHRLGFTIIQGYGLTETSGAATATYVDDNRVGSVGKPMPGTELKIDGPNSEGIGEVLLRGPIVFKGYYKNPEATAEAFTEDGWFRTGDPGRLDKDEHLYIVGRGKDVIVLPSGKNVHPEDIEVHYLKCPLVEEMAIIGIKDEAAGFAGAEKLAAVVVPDFEYLRTAKVANSKEAVRHALDNLGRELPEYQRVREYIIRAEPLPRTATRKIKRFQIAQEVEIGGETALKERKTWQFSPEDEGLLATNIGSTVTAAIRQNAPDADTIHPAMNLEIDLGLDSLARAETFAALENAFSTEFEADEAARALTVGNVIELVRTHVGESAEAATLDLNWGKIVRDAEEFPEVRPVLRDKPIFHSIAFCVYRTFNLFCRWLLKLEVHGVEILDKQKRPFLICPNHQSFLDPFVLTSNYPYHLFRNIFHVGATEFFQGRFMRWVAGMLNVVPVNPDTELMRAMKAGAIGLRNGKVLNIYPEGERAFDGDLHNFKKGAAILATELDLPIVPVALDGLHKVWARRSWRIRLAKVKIKIGEPFYPRDVLTGTEASDEERYETVTEHLRSAISSMIDELRKA